MNRPDTRPIPPAALSILAGLSAHWGWLLALVLAAMLTSRVLSPQYTQWVLGLLAVCALRPAPWLRRVAVLLLVSAVCGQAVYPWLYGGYLQGAAGATAVQTVRLIALAWAAVECWRPIGERGPRGAVSGAGPGDAGSCPPRGRRSLRRAWLCRDIGAADLPGG